MAPRFLKKLKTSVEDLVSKMTRALRGSSSDSIRAESMASPATQEKDDAKARARFPSTIPARERMALDN
ncbi:hypothetical protein M436DRAFT_35372 [Aureobasidium namibiae CBS 147.97]|uniref:Uncharacterized protein n=1 Tax=Aureobasidium namibiae CBS 147.97 TaxID=1043004 RepID=A0A074XTT2_9PEZI